MNNNYSITTDHSWDFLIELYDSAPCIINTIYKTISLTSKKMGEGIMKVTSGKELTECIKHFISSSNNTSYQDFIKYVAPESNQETQATELLENSFLNNFWNIIYSLSSGVESHIIKDLQISSDDKIPYMLLCSFDIWEDWFIFGKYGEYLFVDDNSKIKDLKNCLQQGFHTWNNFWRKYVKNWNFIYRLHSTRLSSEQCYPLSVLLIILRREMEFANNGKYLEYRKLAMQKYNPDEDATSTILYELYSWYKNADEELKKKCEKKQQSRFLRPIALRIIENKSFDKLMYEPHLLNKSTLYKDIEHNIEEDKTRFLLDYKFPETHIRYNDVFYPKFNDNEQKIKTYLSLHIGSHYKEIYRKPHENEKFDFIQIEPIYQDGKFEDNRAMFFRKYLKSDGEFLIIESKELKKIRESISVIFSNFRHDLKPILQNIPNIYSNLQSHLKLLDESREKFENIINILSIYLKRDYNNTEQKQLIDNLYNSIKLLNKLLIKEEFKKLKQDKDISENLNNLKLLLFEQPNNLEEIEKQYNFLQCISLLIQKRGIEISKNMIKRVKKSHEIIDSYIKIAGQADVTVIEDVEFIPFLNEYIIYKQNLYPQVNYTIEFDFNNSEQKISLNKVYSYIMFESIIDNAIKHGFNNLEDENKSRIIHFHVSEVKRKEGEFIKLAICNNGCKMTIKDEEFKIRGFAASPTGHTGIGGYQINKYAELQGGYLQIPNNSNWNAEIDIYYKK